MAYAGIVFFGSAGSGKTLSATIAESLLTNHYHGLSFRYSFAYPLKQMFCQLPIVDPVALETDRNYKTTLIDELDKTPRQLLQTLGTEWGRELVHEDLWTICASRYVNDVLSEDESYTYHRPPIILIDDGRFDNELAWAIENNFFTVLLLPENLPLENTTDKKVHPSERVPTPQMMVACHRRIYNSPEAGNEALKKRLFEVLEYAGFISA